MSRYRIVGSEAECETGSNGLVLRNLLGITDPEEMTSVEQGLLRQLYEDVLSDPVCHELHNALSSVHVELILIHPFREGNGRIARLLCDVMAVQAEIGPLDYKVLDQSPDDYFVAIQAGLGRDFEPMKQLFSRSLSHGD